MPIFSAWFEPVGTSQWILNFFRYGNTAGEVTNDAINTAGNVINIAQSANYLTAKGLAKRTAKETGKAIVEDYKVNNESTFLPNQHLNTLPTYSQVTNPSEPCFSGSLYPNLPTSDDTSLVPKEKK